ncbi:hypothetical protein GMRT_13210 [Giardia muris]|uniref:Uncharacterized protein n=1 Tax=Giardia muris TaxID=5742 RepID=A0A4Z1T3X5_GIAMU|nr:hypothetical protein GMRT_13210 [Giardia muris]|eukprot:TNJ28683.1 hypothetical protein GMRT_13210 [Giardia muris]
MLGRLARNSALIRPDAGREELQCLRSEVQKLSQTLALAIEQLECQSDTIATLESRLEEADLERRGLIERIGLLERQSESSRKTLLRIQRANDQVEQTREPRRPQSQTASRRVTPDDERQRKRVSIQDPSTTSSGAMSQMGGSHITRPHSAIEVSGTYSSLVRSVGQPRMTSDGRIVERIKLI